MLVLPHVGVVKVRGRAWPGGLMPKMATVSRDRAGRWWLSFSLDEPAEPWRPAPEWACGIDLGVSRWLNSRVAPHAGAWIETLRRARS